MSDLEQQASTWVPPWQRHAPEPEPPRSFLDEIDDIDEDDEAGESSTLDRAADSTAAGQGDAASPRQADADVAAQGDAASGGAGQSGATASGGVRQGAPTQGGQGEAAQGGQGAVGSAGQSAPTQGGQGSASRGAPGAGQAGVAQGSVQQGVPTQDAHGGAGHGAPRQGAQDAAHGSAAEGAPTQDAPTQGGQGGAGQGVPAQGGQGVAQGGAGHARGALSADLAAAVAARLGSAGPSNEDTGESGDGEERIPDLAAAAGAMLAHSLAEIDAAAAEARAAKVAEDRAARKERQKKAPEPTQEPEAPEPEDTPALGPLLEVSEEQLVPVLEAILMVVDEPVSEITLAQVLDMPAETIGGVLIDLSARYSAEGRGFDLRRAAGGWRFYTRTEYSSYVERFVLDGQQLRLTQASLETLAVVAYKQPVTRSRVSAIRGVNCDGVIRTLVTRGMIEECGTEHETGAHLYRTTSLFLEKMGLDSVEQLPPLAPFLPDNLEELAASE